MSTRILIIGNSGAGKSVLGHKLANLLALPLVDLDRLHWEDTGYARKRDPDAARQMVAAAAADDAWIIEGVYGWLADVALPRTTDLVWLDLPWDVCREGLMARKASTSRPAEDRQELLAWAQAYWERDTSSSFAGHKRIFDNFSGRKFRIGSRNEAEGVIGRLIGND
jgi:adenylate kinase family enzyme